MSSSELTQQSPVQVQQVPRKRASKTTPISYRIQILIRFVVALFGGYALSALLAVVISLAFKNTPTSAVMTATMLAFICHVCVFIWVFLQHSLIKSMMGVMIPLLILTVIYLGLGGTS
ncbi:iron transporter [Acinetobacter sp. WU_MDCI_Axc73]|nr:iron transporter [Acinetobacter sp. WU_MDCI_Axc73]